MNVRCRGFKKGANVVARMSDQRKRAWWVALLCHGRCEPLQTIMGRWSGYEKDPLPLIKKQARPCTVLSLLAGDLTLTPSGGIDTHGRGGLLHLRQNQLVSGQRSCRDGRRWRGVVWKHAASHTALLVLRDADRADVPPHARERWEHPDRANSIQCPQTYSGSLESWALGCSFFAKFG
jgi:hypothetical protein